MEVKFFRKANGHSPVEDFIVNSLQPKDQKRAYSAIERVQKQQYGLDNLLKAGYAKKIRKRYL